MSEVKVTITTQSQGNLSKQARHTMLAVAFRRTLALLACVMACSLPAIGAQKRALLIGVSAYPRQAVASASWPVVHGANDISLLLPTLQRQGFTVKTLANDKATASAIRKALGEMRSQAGKGDLVYIHFSGHGQPFEDLSGDEADGWDESIVPYDAQRVYSKRYKGANHIVDDELARHIRAIRTKVGPAGFVYVIIDACHSGGSSREESEADAEAPTRGTHVGFSPHGKRYVPKIDRRGHMKVEASPKLASVCYMEACRSYQSNKEIKVGMNFYGPLSYYVNRTLSLIPLSPNTSWVGNVVRGMQQDQRLINQNPVIETDR